MAEVRYGALVAWETGMIYLDMFKSLSKEKFEQASDVKMVKRVELKLGAGPRDAVKTYK